MSPYSKSFCPKSTQFWFVPSQCQSNPLHFNRQTWLHNHILRYLFCNCGFPILPKHAIDIVKKWHSNCSFFVTTSLKSSIKREIETILPVAQRWTKNFFWATSKTKLIECALRVELLDSRHNLNSVFSLNYSLTFTKKITIEKPTFVKEDSIEKPTISITTPEFVPSETSKECL